MLTAVNAAGYAGADLRALCAGAVMAAVRRSAPHILLGPRLEQGLPLGLRLQSQGPQDDAPEAWQQQQRAHLGQSVPLSSPLEPGGSQRSAGDGEQGRSLAQGASGGRASASEAAQADPAEEREGSLQHSQHAAILALGGRLAVNETEPHQHLPDGSAASLAPLQNGHAEPLAAAQPKQSPETGNARGSAPARAGGNYGTWHIAFEDSAQERHLPLGAAGVGAASAASALEGLSVHACDWREALASAPEACARRDSLAALSADAAQPLPAALAPALLPACASALQVLVHVFTSRLP